jgi:hypothetical protein
LPCFWDYFNKFFACQGATGGKQNLFASSREEGGFISIEPVGNAFYFWVRVFPVALKLA